VRSEGLCQSKITKTSSGIEPEIYVSRPFNSQNYVINYRERLMRRGIRYFEVKLCCGSLPRPGTKMLQKRQNHARGTGSTGMAARIMDPLSTSEGSSFGLLSS
jgi:hypothetical protein